MVAAVMDGAYDWTRAGEGDQRKLYDAIMGVMKTRVLTWNVVFAQAFAHAGAVSLGYEDNLRKGRAAARRAHLLFDWFTVHHPERAAELRWTLEGETAAAWEALIADQTPTEGLGIIRLPDHPPGVVSFADLPSLMTPRLRLGERFCFALDSSFDGTVLALQMQRRCWYVLPLARNQMVAALRSGRQHLPFDEASAAPIPLTETETTGLCHFAFVLTGTHEAVLNLTAPPRTAIAPSMLNGLARSLVTLPRDAWRLLIQDVQFTD